MRIVATTKAAEFCGADALMLPVYRSALPDVTDRIGNLLGLDLTSIARRFGLREVGDVCWVPSDAPELGDLLLVDVGPGEPVAADDLRTAVMSAVRHVDRERVACAMAAVPTDGDAGAIVAEALAIGAYGFDRYRASHRPRVGEFLVIGATDETVKTGATIGECTNYARDLVNTPGGDLTPEIFAEMAQAEARRYGFECRIHGQSDLAAGGFGGIVGVGCASANPPVLIELRSGGEAEPATALVGKGITFDSGGLDLKKVEAMILMKNDMAGAASILATFIAVHQLDLSVPLRGYLACAENMPGSRALRPGDVLRHRNGLTAEIVSPDAEGRLVLGDALAYAVEHAPREVIDVATLTGATALGQDLWGVLGTSPPLVASLLDAGRRAGEPGWELPLWDGYASSIRSDLADLKNFHTGMKWSYGAILGALYLREFVGDIPWAHLDIGATCLRHEPNELWPAGATGSATRTLIRYLRDQTKVSTAAPMAL